MMTTPTSLDPRAPSDPASADLVLRQVTLPDGATADVLLADGRISAIGPAGSPTPARTSVEELDGYVLLPAFVEPHAHLDKAFTADLVANPTGSLDGAITAWLAARVAFDVDHIAARAHEAARRYLAQGTTAIRSHVDTGEGIDLRAFVALSGLRPALEGLVDLQIVALCSRPVTGLAGATNRALVAEALAAGADLVGGAPAIDDDPAGAVDALAELAVTAGVGLDLHIDETLDPEAFSLGRLLEVARAGFPSAITASHVVSLGQFDLDRQQRVAAELAEAGVAVVTLPQTNLFLQGRGHRGPVPRGLTAVRSLLDAGVTVAAGGDNIQDPFNPMGRADPLEAASLLVVAAHLAPGEALSAVTSAARRALGLDPVAVEVGAPADLVAVRGASASAALAAASPERVVLAAGRVVARTKLEVSNALADRRLEGATWS